MKTASRIALLLWIVAGASFVFGQSPVANCLPSAIKPATVVEASKAGQVTIEQKLRELGATCDRANQLVDGNGRPIVFVHLTGCWGNPPPGYQEILQKQRREIEQLKQEHTVITITCNPSGVRIP